MRFKSNTGSLLLLFFIVIFASGCRNQDENESANGSGPESSAYPLIATPGPELLRGNDALYGYEGVSFGYSGELAQNVSGSRQPAYTEFGIFYTGSDLIRPEMPDYIEITLQTESQPARIGVQPVRDAENQSYTGFSPEDVQRISAIENDVRNRSGAVNMMPVPPKLGYIEFTNGTGRRYLGFKPTDGQQTLNNETLYYLFEGVTENGRFLVWFEYPISTTFLADADPAATVETIYSQLDDLPSDLFAPELIKLDALVVSLNVEPAESFTYTTAAGAAGPGQIVVTLGDIVGQIPPEVYAVNQATNQQVTGLMPPGIGLKQVTLTVPAGDYQVFAHVPGDVNGTFLGVWDMRSGNLQTVTVGGGQTVTDPILTLPDDPCSQALPATPDGKYPATDSETFKHINGCVTAVLPVGGEAGTGGTLHTVQAEDTLLKISRLYGVDWQRIARVNGIGAPYVIYPGQQIIIPAP